MKKYNWLVFWSFAILFLMPLFAHADEQNYLNYDVNLDAYYWGTKTSTPVYSSSAGSYGVDADVRFKGTEANHWGLGFEFQSITPGPTFSTATFSGQANTFVLGSGLVSSSSMTFGGGKIRYFFPTDSKTSIAAYLDYFAASGNRSLLGGGLEGSVVFNPQFTGAAFVDFDNASGSIFSAQNVVRYDLRGIYHFPNSQLNGFLGYRSYSFSKFFNTTISGVELGLGVRF